MSDIIVLETRGKREDVDYVNVHLFKDKKEADAFCLEISDSLQDQKYWRLAEIIEEGSAYEVCRYENIKSNY